MKNLGINLTGGGARGSYQAGVLNGLIEILKEQGLSKEKTPLQHWSGVSAGSINATFCAANITDLDQAMPRLLNLWATIQPHSVYLTDVQSLSRNSVKWIRDLTLGPLSKKKLARSLLDTLPLWDLLKNNIEFEKIDASLESGILKSLACSAYSYRDNQTVTFLQTREKIEWHKTKRYSKNVKINAEHVMASCAIPLLFPSIPIANEYFADGGFRNTTPISPIIHMGAKKILVISVRGPDEFSDKTYIQEPGIAKIAGVILNALFFDTIEIDLERVSHMNEIVTALHRDIKTSRSDYTAIDFRMIRPSRDVSRMAAQKTKKFPKLLEFLMGGLGSVDESAELASYILFVPEFTKDLIDLGYHDVLNQKTELLQWFEK